MRAHIIGLTILLALLLPARAVCPQNALKPGDKAHTTKTKPAPPPGDLQTNARPADKMIIEHAGFLHGDPNTHVYHLTSDASQVQFANKDTHLFCDEADYHDDTDTAQARGHLKVTSPDAVITGDLIDADFGKDLVVITGNVTIVTQKHRNKTQKSETPVSLEKSKPAQPAAGLANKPANDATVSTIAPKPKGKEENDAESYKEKKTTITCERVEYYYAEGVKRMVATPRVKAVQEDKTVLADQAVYEDLARLVTLTGNVVLNTEKGDEMHCTKAVISVDDNWVQAEHLTGVTLHKSKNDQGKSNKPAPTTPTPPAQAAPPKPGLTPAAPAAPPRT